MKTTPSNCKLEECTYNQLPPPENSQECIACEGNLKKNWRPRDNPAVRITLHFQDGAALDFIFEKPVPQVTIMATMGGLLGKTGNPMHIDLPEPKEEKP